jgi:hypothetical protein
MIATTLTNNKLQVPLSREVPGKFRASVSLSQTDEDLAREASKGDMVAFEALVRRRREGLVRFLASFSGNTSDAEDLAQETFLRAFRSLSRYDPRKPFLTWLFVIARRLAINFKRNRSRREGKAPFPKEKLSFLGTNVQHLPIPVPCGQAPRKSCLPTPTELYGFTMGKACR